MKKLTSIMLAVLMVLTACVTVLPVSAADGDPFQVGEDTYATLAEAYAALPDEGGTITMQNDYNATGVSLINITINKPITIEGQNHRIYNASAYVFRAAGNVTLKNLTWEGTHGFRAMGAVTLINVTANITAGLFMNVQNSDSNISGNCGDVMILNSTITKTAGSDPVFAFYGTNRTMTIENSTVTRACATTNDAAINCGVIGVGATGATINVVDSTITLNPSAGSTKRGYVFSTNGDHDATLNLNAGSVLEISGDGTGLVRPTFINNDEHYTINDKGCTYKIGAKAAEVGVMLPKVDKLNDVDNTYTTFVSGTKSICENDIYMDANATETVSFTATAGTAPTLEGKFKIGNTPYDTLAAAYAAAVDGDTIVQVAPIYTSSEQITVAKKITFDGDGNRLYLTASYCFILTSNAMMLKNVKGWNIRYAIRPTANATQADPQVLTVENCHLVGDTGLMINGSQGTFNNTTDTYNNIVVKDSTLLQCGNAEEFVLLRQQVNSTLNIENSTLLYYSKNKSYAIQLENYTKNGTTDITYAQGIKTLNVDATSTIVYAGTNTSAVRVIEGQFGAAAEGAGNYAYLNLAAGATLKIDNCVAANGNFTNRIPADHITDAGANYVVSAAVAKKGVTLPAHTTLENGDTILGYTVNGDKLTMATSYTDANATAPVTFKAVGIDLSGFDTVDAASIRLGAPYGIRFGTTITKTLKDTLESYGTVEYGMVSARQELLTSAQKLNNATTVDALGNLCVKQSMNQFYKDNVDGVYQYNVAIAIGTDPELNKNDGATYQKTLLATGYFTITVDGVSKTFYAETVAANSIYGVAQAYYNDTVNGSTTNATINGIIAACQPQS